MPVTGSPLGETLVVFEPGIPVFTLGFGGSCEILVVLGAKLTRVLILFDLCWLLFISWMSLTRQQQSDHRRPYPPRSTRSFSSRPFSEDSSPRRGEDLWDTPAVSGSGGSFGDGAFRMDSSGGGGGRERPWAREKRVRLRALFFLR